MSEITSGWIVVDSAENICPVCRAVFRTQDEAAELARADWHDYNFILPVRVVSTGEAIKVKEFEP